jgi:hypothetical protein
MTAKPSFLRFAGNGRQRSGNVFCHERPARKDERQDLHALKQEINCLFNTFIITL